MLPWVVAHRGASSIAPENTASSFKSAKALGAEWVEFDVMLTADRIPIVFHDLSLARITRLQKNVNRVPSNLVKDLDAGTWFSSQFKGERVPTFKEIVQICADLELGINVELKPRAFTTAALVDVVLDTLVRFWPKTHPEPLLSSFSWPCLMAVRRRNPNIALGLLLASPRPGWARFSRYLKARSVHIELNTVNQAFVDVVHGMGKKVAVYTVNSSIDAKRCQMLGVDAVFSDYPQRLLPDRSKLCS